MPAREKDGPGPIGRHAPIVGEDERSSTRARDEPYDTEEHLGPTKAHSEELAHPCDPDSWSRERDVWKGVDMDTERLESNGMAKGGRSVNEPLLTSSTVANFACTHGTGCQR